MNARKGKPQPTRWDSSAKEGRRITFRQKIVICDIYDTEMGKGRKRRDDILDQLAKKYDVVTRQIERYIEEVRDLPIKETCDLIERWILQVKQLLSSPEQTIEEMVAENQEMFLEPWAKRVILSPEVNVPINIKLEDTERIHCKVERDILFKRLRKHLDARLWKDYERFTRRVLQYDFACRRVFSELVRSASQALEELGCATQTRITFAKTVFQETINPLSYFGYAVKPPSGDDRSYGLRFGHDLIAVGESAEQLQGCRAIHENMRERMREWFSQGFQPTQVWKEIDELRIDLLGQLERLLRQFELPRPAS
jgi:hypothetical protein